MTSMQILISLKLNKSTRFNFTGFLLLIFLRRWHNQSKQKGTWYSNSKEKNTKKITMLNQIYEKRVKRVGKKEIAQTFWHFLIILGFFQYSIFDGFKLDHFYFATLYSLVVYVQSNFINSKEFLCTPIPRINFQDATFNCCFFVFKLKILNFSSKIFFCYCT